VCSSDLTALGSIAVLVMIALMTGGYLLLSRRWRQAGLLALALGGGIFASEVLKGVFERARPPAGYRTFDVLNYSFPSGHALLSAVLYPTLAIMLAGALQQRAVRIYVLAIGVLLALIVGSTRVYLAAHWASDVLAGWCVGAAWAILCWIAVRLLQSRLTPSPETPAPRG